jgi:aminoglycoside phosphotransferase (APT) family kinase protein
MIDGLGITAEALGAYLEGHVRGFSRLTGLRKFSDGQSNPTYLIEAESGRYVLRAKPPGKLLKSAHNASPIGRAFLVMQYLDGRIFWDPALPDLDRAERGPIYDAMNATLAALHSVDVKAVGLGDFGKPGNYFARQTDRWTHQYRASVLEERPEVDRLIAWLEEHMPADDGQVALVHGDYRLDNMIFAPDAPRVIALLDWELSTLGHPLADLAYQCMQWRLPHAAGMRGLGGLDRSALGLPTEAEYVAAYCARRGIERIGNWPFYLAFAFFRLAAILEGVVRRAHDGNASNPKTARKYATAIPLLARAALDVTREGA